MNGAFQYIWQHGNEETHLSVEMYQKAYNHPFLCFCSSFIHDFQILISCVLIYIYATYERKSTFSNKIHKILIIIFKNLFMKILIRQNFLYIVYIHLWVLFVFLNVFVLWYYLPTMSSQTKVLENCFIFVLLLY